MKILNKIVICALSASFLIGGTSCNDFLYKDPEKTIDAETVDYNDLSQMYGCVSGCYAWLRQEGLHWAVYAMTIGRDDDVHPGSTGDDWTKFENYNYDNTLWFWNEPFSVLYFRLIKYCNKALEDLEQFEVNCTTEADLALNHQYQGEVRYMRAYSYFRLVQLFGPVPILYENTQVDMHRRSVESVYAYALEDLDYCINNMERLRPNQMGDHMGAFTAFTAEMLAAKIHMNQGNYAEVYRLTKDIIDNGNFSLYPDYSELFKIPGKLCDESLMEIQTTDFGGGSADEIYSQWFEFQGPANNAQPSGWGWIWPLQEFVDWAKDRGETVRYDNSFLFAGTTTKWGDVLREKQGAEYGIYNAKAYTPISELNPGSTKYGSNNNVRVFRYSDVLLMYAEACARGAGGTMSDAYKAVMQVRDRAGFDVDNTSDPYYISEAEFISKAVDFILDERRIELCMEWGERFNDLVRTGTAVQVLTSKGFNYTEDQRYLPIPKAAIDINPELAEPVVD